MKQPTVQAKLATMRS